MKGIRTGGLFLAVIVANLLACAGASAAPYEPRSLPELGKCAAVAAHTGVYRASNCITVQKTGGGSYEWTPLETPVPFSGSGLATVLRTTGHPTVKCSSSKIAGEWTTQKKASLTAEFLGCTNLTTGQPCQSETTSGQIKSLSLEGFLGFIKNEVKEGKTIVTVGLDIKPQTPLTVLATYNCGSPTEPASIEGSVIAQIKPIDTKPTTQSNLVFKVSKTGAQVPEKLFGEPTDTLSTTFTSGLSKTTAPTTLSIAKYVGKQSTPLEIKAKEN
jgi:hypothetical protein